MKLLITTDWYYFRSYTENRTKKYTLELLNEHQDLLFKTVIIQTVDIVKETIKELKLQHKDLKIGYKNNTDSL